MVGNVIPLMGNLCDQLTEQLNKVRGQVGNLPRYQVDWSALHEIMRDSTKEFQKLRRITGKCLPLVSNDDHKCNCARVGRAHRSEDRAVSINGRVTGLSRGC